jgi:hypothetical protein
MRLRIGLMRGHKVRLAPPRRAERTRHRQWIARPILIRELPRSFVPAIGAVAHLDMIPETRASASLAQWRREMG